MIPLRDEVLTDIPVLCLTKLLSDARDNRPPVANIMFDRNVTSIILPVPETIRKTLDATYQG